MKVTEIKKQIQEQEQILRNLEEQHKALDQQVAGLEAERREHAVPAHVHGNEEAQRALREISGQLQTAQHEHRDVSLAIEQTKNKLTPLRTSLALAERMAERDRVREFVKVRAQREHPARIVELVRLLEAELHAWNTDRAEIDRALVDFDPRFKGHSLSARWREPVRIDYGRRELFERFETAGPLSLQRALLAIEACPIPGEPLPSDRCAYQATHNGNYFGFDMHAGDTVHMRPSDAAEYVKAGVLRECKASAASAVSPLSAPAPAAQEKPAEAAPAITGPAVP